MSHIIPNNGSSESADYAASLQGMLGNRFLEAYSYSGKSVKYAFSDDKGMLHQYYRLREMMYKVKHPEDSRLNEYGLGENFHDKISHVLVANKGNLCLGGCGLVIREPDENWLLPMESADFNLRESFPELALDKVRHAEVSSFAVMEDCGDDNILNGLCEAMYNKIINSDINYVFVKAPYHIAKNWKKVVSSLGFNESRIIEGDKLNSIPKPEEIKWYFVISDFTVLGKNNDHAGGNAFAAKSVQRLN